MVTRTDAEAPSAKEEIPHDHLFKVTGLSSSNLDKLAQGRSYLYQYYVRGKYPVSQTD